MLLEAMGPDTQGLEATTIALRAEHYTGCRVAKPAAMKAQSNQPPAWEPRPVSGLLGLGP
jgi:hypothetical protein